jgi:hypothetical protein
MLEVGKKYEKVKKMSSIKIRIETNENYNKVWKSIGKTIIQRKERSYTGL